MTAPQQQLHCPARSTSTRTYHCQCTRTKSSSGIGNGWCCSDQLQLGFDYVVASAQGDTQAGAGSAETASLESVTWQQTLWRGGQ
jgi:hypothetical protein